MLRIGSVAMAEPTRPARPGRISLGGDDLPIQAADKVVELVDSVKTKTTDNAVVAVRAVVYGLVVAVLGIMVLTLLIVVAVRLADAYLPIGSGVGDATWAAHLFVGTLVTILGLGAWASRRGTGKPTPLIIAAVVDVLIVLGVVIYGIIDAAA